jgi:hypothetical protein
MQSFIEPLYKSADKIQFGWNPEPGAVSYVMYVGLSKETLVLLYGNIPPYVSKYSNNLGKVPKDALIADVQAALGVIGTFANAAFFFAITFVNASSVESPLSESTVVEVPPVGVTQRFMRDDPSINRHGYVFSNELQKWVKMLGTSTGALVVDSAPLFSANTVTEYTYDGTNVATVKMYPSDATSAGSPAKLTAYTYNGGLLTKVSTSDSTV